jgi:hypothetical protein
MHLFNIIERATDFGSFRSRNNFLSFALKVLFYIFPAIILGYYTDITIKTLKNRKVFGDNKIYYIIFQTLVIITTMYLFVFFLTDFTSEFQQSMAGGYFIVLYFGIQANYIRMLKEYMSSLV